MQNGQQYVQAKNAFEILKGKYVYSKGVATITYNGNTIILKQNETKLKRNGQSVDLGKKCGFLKSNKFYVASDIFEMLGVKIVTK